MNPSEVDHDEDVVDGFLFLSFDNFDDLKKFEAQERNVRNEGKVSLILLSLRRALAFIN